MRLKILGCAIYLAEVISSIDVFTFGQASTPVGWVYTTEQKFLLGVTYLGALLFLICGFLVFFKPIAAYVTSFVAGCLMWPAFFPIARQVVQVLIEDPRFQFTRLHGINDIISVSLLLLATAFSAVQAGRTFKLVNSER